MEPELKTYLGKMEERLTSKVDDVLSVVKDVAENTSVIMEKIEDDLTKHTERIDSLSSRVSYLEEKVLK